MKLKTGTYLTVKGRHYCTRRIVELNDDCTMARLERICGSPWFCEDLWWSADYIDAVYNMLEEYEQQPRRDNEYSC